MNHGINGFNFESNFITLNKGIGFSVNTVNNYVNIYFTMVLTYSIIFLVLSFNTQLPWEKCNPKWKAKSIFSSFFVKMNIILLLET